MTSATGRTQGAAGDAGRIRLGLSLPVHPYLRDHRFSGEIILPAVEILQHLAASALLHHPETPVHSMQNAAFERFLYLSEDEETVEAVCELVCRENGAISARLTSTAAAGRTGLMRTKVHASVDFTEPDPGCAPLPIDLVSALDGVCCEIPAEKIYSDLVPFGPAFQSITGPLILTESGAACTVRAIENMALAEPLGSPFPLDGAFHAACVWGQRYRHILAFPVGFETRRIFVPTVAGQDYRCVVFPAPPTGERDSHRFHIRIYGMDGRLHEEIGGVMMKDVFKGSAKPPDWIREDGDSPLALIGRNCRAVAVVDSRSIAGFAQQALSEGEEKRLEKMGEKRKKSFLAARLALKHLARKLTGDQTTPAADLHTVMPDNVHPRCPAPGTPLSCSVSHDSRFAFAAADNEALGVDVEQVSERVLKARHIFMLPAETTLADTSSMGALQASIRIWSIKECVTKITDRPLAEAWHNVSVHAVGDTESRLTAYGIRYVAYHDTVEDHIFTLVKEASPTDGMDEREASGP